MNAPRLKAIHTAIRSGIGAADSVVEALAAGRANDRLEHLPARVMATGIGRELYRVRNVKPLWSRFGTVLGVLLGGIDMWVNHAVPLLAVRHAAAPEGRRRRALARLGDRPEEPTRRRTTPSASTAPSSVFLANIAHDEDQPVHLRLADPAVPLRDTPARPMGPSRRRTTARPGCTRSSTVGGQPAFRINAQNCVHCKTCDIKDPAHNITWVPPEGGCGPNYVGM